MSLASLAAAATVYDRIEDVARDAGYSVRDAQLHIIMRGYASVDDDGNVTMSERQSVRAAGALDFAAVGL